MPFAFVLKIRDAVPALCLVLGLLFTLPADLKSACSDFSFASPPFYSTNVTGGVTIADFNGDGSPDLLVAGGSGQSLLIYVLYGRPDGSFSSPVAILPSMHGSGLVSGDFDGDGRPDIAVLDATAHEIIIFLNRNGTFEEAKRVSISVSSPRGLLVGDFNGDGHQDLIFTGDAPGSLVVLLGNGDGTFRQQTITPQLNVNAAGLWISAVADFDRDGLTDVVITSSSGGGAPGNVAILFGDRQQTLTGPTVYAFSDSPLVISVGDLDGNGTLDVLVGMQSSRFGYILDAGKRSGGRSGLSDVQLFPGGAPAVIADFDGDGIPDIATATFDLTVIRGLGSMRFQLQPSYLLLGSGQARFVGAADLNRDGAIDLIASVPGGIEVFLNDGRGGWRSPARYQGAFAVGDVNSDGRSDIVGAATAFLADGVKAWLATRDGTFGPPPSTDYAGPSGSQGDHYIVDINGDGRPDLIVIWPGSYKNPPAITVGLGDGNGNFSLLPPLTLNFRAGFNSSALADLNGDGRLDVVVLNSFVEPPWIAFGRGDGTFDALVPLNVPGNASAVAAGDFAGHGYADLVLMLGYPTNGLVVVENDGKGHFGSPRLIDSSYSYNELYAVDVNNDKKTDLVALSDTTVSVFVNKGDGTFFSPRRYLLGLQQANGLRIADLNGDGRLDIGVVGRGPTDFVDYFAILPGLPDGEFGEPQFIRSTGGKVEIGDFNADGKLDLLDGGYPRLNTCTEERPRRRAVR